MNLFDWIMVGLWGAFVASNVIVVAIAIWNPLHEFDVYAERRLGRGEER